MIPKNATFSLLFVIFIFFIFQTAPALSQSVAESDFFKAVAIEESAKNEQEYKKAAQAYANFHTAFSSKADKDLLAAALYAQAQIYLTNLSESEKAEKIFQQIVTHYPKTRWAKNSKIIIRETQGKKTISSELNHPRNNMQGTGFDTPPENPVYRNSYKMYDPARITPDLIIPVSKSQWKKDIDFLKKIQKEPHLGPIDEDQVLTGSIILKKLLKNVFNNRPCERYIFRATLKNLNNDFQTNFSAIADKKNFKIIMPDFTMTSFDKKNIFYFINMKKHYILNSSKNKIYSLFKSIRDFSAFAIYLFQNSRIISHYTGFEDNIHHVKLYFSDQKGPVFFSLLINEEMTILQEINIHDFNSKKIITTGLDISISSCMENDGVFEIPVESEALNSIPEEFILPLIFH